MSLNFKPLLALGFIGALSWSSAVLAETSCTASIGAKDAKVLADQCIQISPATHPPCNAQNSCDIIKEEITRGCDMAKSMGGQVPKFCSTASAPQATPTTQAATAPVSKPEIVAFQSPSKNIFCIFSNAGENSSGAEISCEINQFTPSFDKAYAATRSEEECVAGGCGCEPKGLKRYQISANSPAGQNFCPAFDLYDPVDGSIAAKDIITLAYGSAFQKNGLSCLSEQTGVTCKNPAGHGFSLSKAKQQVF